MKCNLKHMRDDVARVANHSDDEWTCDFLNQVLDHWPEEKDTWSDGYHSFRELYDHRMSLFISLMKMQQEALSIVEETVGLSEEAYNQRPWWSRQHHRGGDPMFVGMVIAGMCLGGKQISYHLGADDWVPILKAAGIRELEYAVVWDGHSPNDVVNRMKEWCCERDE